MLASGAATIVPLLPRETCEEAYRSGPDRLFAGSGQPAGTAVAEAGGFRVNGRWPFASEHAVRGRFPMQITCA